MLTEAMSLVRAAYETLGPVVLLLAAIPTLLVVGGVCVGCVRRRFARPPNVLDGAPRP